MNENNQFGIFTFLSLIYDFNLWFATFDFASERGFARKALLPCLPIHK